MIVQQRLSALLKELGGESGHRYADILDTDLCSPYSGFGSMGPDFLFFSLKEYRGPLNDLVNFWFDVYDALDPLIKFHQKYIEPVADAIDGAVSAADDVLFKGLFQQLGNTADELRNTALTAAGVIVTDNIDLYYPFYPKVQQGEPESKWYWVDMLHERRTGMFASHLWELAAGDKDLQRYALGYASHFGTDVVGHSVVNAISGGPFRTHWHRHKLVENWIDAYARAHYQDNAQIKKCLNIGSEDVYVSNAISGSYYYRLTEFPGGKLPRKLATMLAQAMKNVYAGAPHPVFLSAEDLDTTYRLFLKWFKRITSIGDAQPPTPVLPPGAASLSLIKDYTSGYPSLGFSGGSSGGSPSFRDILAGLFAFAKWLGEGLAYTIEWIVTHSVDILTLPYVEALALVKWSLYQIQKLNWDMYDTLRFKLVIGGYMNPEPRDLVKWPYGQAFINTAFTHLTGGPPSNFIVHPRKQEGHGVAGPIDHHVFYPGVVQEQPHAEPAPLPFFGTNPEVFISQGHSYDPKIERLYDCKGPYGPNDAFTHHIDNSTWSGPQLGSALSFCARLISQRLEDPAGLPNLNLNSDRGYGWKTWRAKDPENIETNNPIHVDYIDT
jgi:hypothetical protein